MMSGQEEGLVARLAGEGGGIDVLCTDAFGAKMFRAVLRSDRSTFEEDDGPLQTKAAGWKSSLAVALADVPWHWNRFHPIEVDPKFGPQLLALKHAKDRISGGNERVTRVWEEACKAAGGSEEAAGFSNGEQVLAEFRKRLAEKWLPTFCNDPKKFDLLPEGFRHESVIPLSHQDAADFMRALDKGVVIDVGHGKFAAPRSSAEEQIFWHGSKAHRPRPLTLWIEPIITIGAVGRLHSEFDWPTACLGMQSKNWEFDLVAYLPDCDDREYIAGEVKKTRSELDEMLRYVREFCTGKVVESDVPAGSAQNAWKKYQGLLRRRARYFWAIGPCRYTCLFELQYPTQAEVQLTEVALDHLCYPRDSS